MFLLFDSLSSCLVEIILLQKYIVTRCAPKFEMSLHPRVVGIVLVLFVQNLISISEFLPPPNTSGSEKKL